MNFIGVNIKKLRKAKRLSQEELSTISGVNYNTLIKIERNTNNNPTITTILQLAKALNVPINRIVTDSLNKDLYIKNKKELGQVFTSPNVARLMIDILRQDLSPHSKVLDPCIGKNIFFNEYVNKKNHNTKLIGLEIDRSLITEKERNFFRKKNKHLLIENFFDYSIKEKFDRIIINPPYVRQEDLTGKINSKEKIYKVVEHLGLNVSKKSNLYIYFMLKSLYHLKQKGKLVAITYDSWLYSDFGEDFKKTINKLGSIERVIHFKERAFERVNIGATILVISLKKSPKDFSYISFNSPDAIPKKNPLKFIKNYETNQFINSHIKSPEHIRLSADLFTNLQNISAYSISRGISALINKFFLFEKKEFDNLVEIIKDIKMIKNMSVKNEVKYLFNSNENLTEAERKYLNDIKNIIIQYPDLYRSTNRLLREGKKWYQPRLVQPGNIIFNYYFRQNTDFLLNKKLFFSADNFYNLYIQDSLATNFAILNSNFTKYALFKTSKPQGRGLNKLQLNKFRLVRIIDQNKLNIISRRKLNELGLELMDRSRNENLDLIQKIDTILLREYNSIIGQSYRLDHLIKHVSIIKERKYEI